MQNKKSCLVLFILVLTLGLILPACKSGTTLKAGSLKDGEAHWIGNAYIDSPYCDDGLPEGEDIFVRAIMTQETVSTVTTGNVDQYELRAFLFKYTKEHQWNTKSAIVSQKVAPLKHDYLHNDHPYNDYTFTMSLPSSVKPGSYTIVLARPDNTVEDYIDIGIVSKDEATTTPMDTTAAKPVIYLYPEVATDVSVKLDLKGRLTCTYPEYGEGWNITAFPDGRLYDKSTCRYYDYLFWEGKTSSVTDDFDHAACVAASDSAAFLEEYLTAAGLNDSEIDDFISFWLPKLQASPYNLISFPSEQYREWAKLEVLPQPDTEIRIYMVFKPLSEAVEIEAGHELELPERPSRDGFTVVEWGGSVIE